LLISAVGRADNEAFHERIVFVPERLFTALSVEQSRKMYRAGGMVGKQSDLLRRDKQGQLTSNDEEAFGKFNQAINSCVDLIHESAEAGVPPALRVVLPILVVPNGALWQVDYAANGTIWIGSMIAVCLFDHILK
jgi:hypothetical protein